MKNKKGFTLIELLVVIGIIGILSAVVLTSLNVARAKGADAAIRSSLGQIRSQAEIYFDSNQSYADDAADCISTATSIFVADTKIAEIIADAEAKSASTATCIADDGDSLTTTGATSWAVSVPLKSDPLVSWCVDNTGVATTAVATLVSDLAVCQ